MKKNLPILHRARGAARARRHALRALRVGVQHHVVLALQLDVRADLGGHGVRDHHGRHRSFGGRGGGARQRRGGARESVRRRRGGACRIVRGARGGRARTGSSSRTCGSCRSSSRSRRVSARTASRCCSAITMPSRSPPNRTSRTSARATCSACRFPDSSRRPPPCSAGSPCAARRFGRHALAIGGSEEASRLMGLNVDRTLGLRVCRERAARRHRGRDPRRAVRRGAAERRRRLGAVRDLGGGARGHAPDRRRGFHRDDDCRRRCCSGSCSICSTSRTGWGTSACRRTGNR